MIQTDRAERFLGLGVSGAGIVALGFAAFVQHGLHMTPCDLCLLERVPWRITIVLGVVAILLRVRLRRYALYAAAIAMAVSVGLGFFHAGVEWKWWPSPFASCHYAMTAGRTAAERFANMPLRAAKPCDAPTYLFHLPVSMAVLGAIYALVADALLVAGLVRAASAHRRDGRTQG